MATKVTGATIVNTVTYKTDSASLKKARKEIKDLQNLLNRARGGAGGGRGGGAGGGGAGGGGGSSSAAAEARRRIKQARDEARAIANARIRAEKEARERAARAQQEINRRLGLDRNGNPNPNGGRGRGRGRGNGNENDAGRSAEDRARVFQEEFARQERERQERYNRQILEQQRQIDRQRREVLADRAARERRDRIANRVSNQFAFDTGRLNLRPRQIQQAENQMRELNARFRAGAIDLADYRQQARQNLRVWRDQSREVRTLSQRLKDLWRGGNGGLGMKGAALGMGLAGVGGAAYLGAHAARNALRSGVAQSRGLSRVGTMGISAEETQALQLAALRATGFNLSYEKISDISKDVQDKVGQLSLGKWTQNKKSGEWSFGGGGELGDWVKIMTERGGYGREEAVKTLQSAKGPVEFALILDNLRKTAKLTDAEFTALSEAINDFSYITKSVGTNAENVTKAMEELARIGLLYTDQEKDNLKALSNMSATYDSVSNVLQGRFSSAFVDGLKQAGINSDNLAEELAKTAPLMRALGEFVGQTTGAFIKLLQWIPGGAHTKLSENGLYYEDSWVGRGVSFYESKFGGIDNWIASLLEGGSGVNPNSVMGNQMATSPNNPFGISNTNPIQNHLSMTIQIDPNAGELSNAFSAHALDVFNNGMDDLTFDINNMTSNN